MPGLTYYLLRQMTVAAIMTAAGLTFAIWLSQSLRLLDIIVNRGLSIGLALEFLMMLLPSLVALLLPIAVFIAVMVVYLRLGSDSELIVMRNAGISDMGLARPAILFGCVTTILTYGLTLYAIPASISAYRDIQQNFAGSIADLEPDRDLSAEAPPARLPSDAARVGDSQLIRERISCAHDGGYVLRNNPGLEPSDELV